MAGFYKLTKEGNFRHTEKTKEKIGISLSKKLQGTVWIKNDSMSKQIPIEDLQVYLENGWTKGRLLSENARENLKKQKSGAAHACFGRCRIFHEELKKNKTVPKDELSNWLSKGWKLGFLKSTNKSS